MVADVRVAWVGQWGNRVMRYRYSSIFDVDLRGLGLQQRARQVAPSVCVSFHFDRTPFEVHFIPRTFSHCVTTALLRVTGG